MTSGLDAARLRTSREFARLLGAVVRRVRLPMFLIGVLPIAPAVLVLVLAAVIGGSDALIVAGLAALGLVPAGWLLWRRNRMSWAVDPPEALAEELGHAFDVADAWNDVGTGLTRLKEIGERGWGPIALAKGTWHALRVALDLIERVTELPRVEPFTPLRLKTTAFLAVACGVSAAVMAVVAVVGGVLTAVGAL